MGRARMGHTPGERLFQRYLEEHRIYFVDHPQLGRARKRPDVALGDGTRRVICEVADFEVGEPDKPILSALDANKKEHSSGITVATAVGALPVPEIVQRIRTKIVEELAQLGEFRDRYPLAIVLHNAESLSTDLDDHMVLSALCGLLTPTLNTQLSAIAIVVSARPGSDVEERVLRGLRKDEGRHRQPAGRRPSTDDLVRAFETLEKEKRDWGGALDREYPALRIYHNCYATRPVPPSTFPSPFVRHARLVPHDHEERDPETGSVATVIFFTLQEIPLRQKPAGASSRQHAVRGRHRVRKRR